MNCDEFQLGNNNYIPVNDNTILCLHFFYMITNRWNYLCCLSRMRERSDSHNVMRTNHEPNVNLLMGGKRM